MHLPLKYVDTKILEHLMKSKSKGSKILEIALFFVLPDKSDWFMCPDNYFSSGDRG